MSNLLRKRRPTATNEAEIRPTKRQRFVDVTKSLLDIANESADACPPLKSCLGGINALVKYYEGCKDVEDKLGDLLIWLTKLKDSVLTTSAGGNHEEAERREQLTRSLTDIEKQSERLLGKRKAAKILDKRQDSGMVVRLVEELRQAILLYQLSQQRSIDNQVTQLATSFSEFLKLHERAPEIKEKAESILARLGRLTVEGCTTRDGVGSKWKMILFEALEEIKDALQSISWRIGAVGYKENDADVNAVCELAEDVRDAVMEYQIAQQTAIYEQNCGLIDSADLSVLNNCLRAKAAEYRHGNRRGCLKGTRDTVLNEIESWAKDFDESPVFWLNGLAGTGKSTIAQTIAERLFAEGRLGASFFCSRDFEDRRNLNFIFPTLAYQLAQRYPGFRSHFVSLLRSDPDVVHESLYSQMQKLIVEPLRKTGVSMVIVIDALDECKDDEPSSAILSVLARFVQDIPKVKFFITGRPEPRIKTGFRLTLLADSTNVFVLHEVHPTLIENDIRIYLTHELSQLARLRKLKGWPSDEHVDLLCERAAGLFIYAVATVRFLDTPPHLPKNRLDVILKVPRSTVHEGKTRFNPTTTLDSLYTSILQTAFSEGDLDVDSKVRAILGTVVLVVNPLPPLAIAELIGLDPDEILPYLELIQSLLTIDEDSSQPVKPFHKSFPDFIVDPSRCADPRFCVSPGRVHFDLTANCLRLMNDELEQNLLSLPEYALNSEVKDLQARIDGRITIGLQYACQSWHNHLAETKGEVTEVLPYLRIFLEAKFLAWLEVLSVLGDVGSASFALDKVIIWLQETAKGSHLLDIARDCFDFVAKFFEPISASATHIYHSALELCPTSSIVRKSYYDRYHGIARLPRMMIGTPRSWDPTISFSGKDDYKFCAWSPCGRFIAAQTEKVVEIRNQLTFELLTVLHPINNTSQPTSPLAYSPDGRSLASGLSNTIVIWDIQTGGVAKEIECCGVLVSMVCSLDGRTVATLVIDGMVVRLETYEVASGTRLFTEELGPADFVSCRHLWAHEKTFRLAEISRLFANPDKRLRVIISEVGTTLTQIESFTVPMGLEHQIRCLIIFSPSTYRVFVSGPEKFRIVDLRSSDCLFEARADLGYPRFSPDGGFLIGSDSLSTHAWKFTSGSYTRWGKSLFHHDLVAGGNRTFVQFSPASPSVLVHSGKSLRMRRLDNPPTTSLARRQRVAISRSGTYIATAYKDERSITILDIPSQAPLQFIDTHMAIYGLVITGNVLVVAGWRIVEAWLLTKEGKVDGVFGDKRAGYNDCIWSITPSHQPINFTVQGQFGMIRGDVPFIFHTETGEILDRAHKPAVKPNDWKIFQEPSDALQYHCLSPSGVPPEDGWLVSCDPTQGAGWVVDPEGRHRFWIPFEWRGSISSQNWYHDITTLFTSVGDQPIVVKF